MIPTLLIPAADKEIDFSRSGEKNCTKKTDGSTTAGFFDFCILNLILPRLPAAGQFIR